ncbi:MAG: hypothetical protein A2758_03080 [Candidatus Zambryskibacteria bacterium RIFCSPHIGHO2_01_FULL_49_18]|uniref:Phosphomannomutase/phosphoglucomutase n=2 Tax=Parcubacteria group TaxID=1794811 RepID=A0A1G2T3D0_9BACT|nr:MAG: hypothetical protein A2941_02320 [Candidatus Yanofskybacteria bacterium RIFCSPLOWO2_01_FULL_49_17]OHA91763.1 MAG: hypothetical protein A2758_03080 [Candidatus Zambryskibacteria bacterium RIFCSPHIGHO2_01_FULL_49_18]
MDSIFKAYDVRGKYPDELNEETAFKIGDATAIFLKAKKLVVGWDGRTSSETLAQKVIEGIITAGCDVISIDRTTTPLFYFSVNTFSADGGIMITASHNPPEYNGFKIVGPRSMDIGRENGLEEIEKLMEAKRLPAAKGRIDHQKLIDNYINFLVEISGADKEDFSRMRMVADASNGMASLVLANLFSKINVSVVSMFFDIDGRFPNHSSDISQAQNLDLLRKNVISSGSVLGVAFDGDGDRIALVDEKGNIIWPDRILGLLFKYLGRPKTVYDLRISKSIKALMGSRGIVSKVGRTHMQKAMRENDAAIGGELTGHFFFKELRYSESAALAMLYMMVILNRSQQPLSKIIKPLMKYAHSGEISIATSDSPLATSEIFKMLKNKYHDGRLNELDGITVEYPDWWFNLRVSNTEPVLRLVVEAETRFQMEEKQKELLELLRQ